MTSDNKDFFIGIIGSGPIGLECGLHALKYGYQFIIFESGDDIANNVRLWSHVRLFTPLYMNMSLLGKTLLQKEHDDNRFLTGGEYIEHYLRPVSCLLQSNIRLRHRVISVGRHHTNKFFILVENEQSHCEEFVIVDCVIDASGTYNCPNYVGPGNLPAINERVLRTIIPSPITYRIPNLKYEQLAGKRIVLIGKGHSAATSAVLLGKCAVITSEIHYMIF
jgi:cation diffusion facilitator CzcD-associated flavoprotein CzcO